MSVERFYKSDLHIHSPSCFSRNYCKDDFITKLLDSDLEVIAITDHNSIDTDLLNELNDVLSQNNKVLIGGVELNVYISPEKVADKNLTTTDSEYFHAVLWFDIEDIDIAHNCLESLFEKVAPQEDRSNLSPEQISETMKEYKFSLDSIQENFSRLNYYFVFHESKGDPKRNLSGYLPNTTSENKKYKQQLLFYNNALAVEGGDKNKAIQEFMEDNLDTLVANFLCSDAQSIEEIGEKFSWICFSGTFDSMVLPFSDPEKRVIRLTDSKGNPQKNANNSLAQIKFNDIQNSEQIVDFSPGYNGIIGSRGSGKSMLASMLAKSAERNKYHEEYDLSSVRYKLSGMDEWTIECPDNLHLKQGELMDIYGKKEYDNLPFLKDKFHDIIIEKEEENQKKYESIKSIIAAQKSQVLDLCNNYSAEIPRFDFLGNPHSEELMVEVIETSKFESTVDAIESFEKLLEGFCEILEEKKEKIAEFSFPNYAESVQLRNDLFAFSVDAEEKVGDLIKSSAELFKKVQEEDCTPHILRQDLIEQFANLAKANNRKVDAAAEEYRERRTRLDNFLIILLKLRKEIRKNDTEIRERIEEIISPKLSEEIILKDGEKVRLEIKNEIEETLDEFMGTLYNAGVEFGADTIVWIALDVGGVFDGLNGHKFRLCTSLDDYIDKYYERLEEHVEGYKNVVPDVSYKEKSLSSYSPGKITEILLRIVLHDGLQDGSARFIVLDQPEDNLDTKVISDFLVDVIRDFKLELQLFVVSHSATLIINGDANQVIVSKDESDRIRYHAGSINNPSVKDDIVLILDGGEKNLKARLHKYDFQIDRGGN